MENDLVGLSHKSVVESAHAGRLKDGFEVDLTLNAACQVACWGLLGKVPFSAIIARLSRADQEV